MASESRIGKRVRITGGMREFHGVEGVVIGVEGRLYRVSLDEPVEIPGIGRVRDDLWEGKTLKTLKGEGR